MARETQGRSIKLVFLDARPEPIVQLYTQNTHQGLYTSTLYTIGSSIFSTPLVRHVETCKGVPKTQTFLVLQGKSAASSGPFGGTVTIGLHPPPRRVRAKQL